MRGFPSSARSSAACSGPSVISCCGWSKLRDQLKDSPRFPFERVIVGREHVKFAVVVLSEGDDIFADLGDQNIHAPVVLTIALSDEQSAISTGHRAGPIAKDVFARQIRNRFATIDVAASHASAFGL